MELKVLFSEDPAFALRRADEFLSSKAVVHNLVLSILHARVANADPVVSKNSIPLKAE